MQSHSIRVIIAAMSVLCVLSLTSCAAAPEDESQFDPRDFSGVWHMEGGSGQFGPPNPPALTSAGMAAMRGRIPSRSVDDPSLSNDPSYECNPEGFPKILFDAEPMEILQLPTECCKRSSGKDGFATSGWTEGSYQRERTSRI